VTRGFDIQVLELAWETCIRHEFGDIQQDLHRLLDTFKAEYRKMQESHAAERALVKANQEKCVAFTMGSHGRLGAGSFIRHVDPEVLRIIVAVAGLRDCSYL
jgi:hypothetical protein